MAGKKGVNPFAKKVAGVAKPKEDDPKVKGKGGKGGSGKGGKK